MLITYLPEEEPDAQETLHWVCEAGRRAVAVAVDLREQRACQDVVDRAVAPLTALGVGGEPLVVGHRALVVVSFRRVGMGIRPEAGLSRGVREEDR